MKKYILLGSEIEEKIYPIIFDKLINKLNIDAKLEIKKNCSQIEFDNLLENVLNDNISGIMIENSYQKDSFEMLDDLSDKANVFSYVNVIYKSEDKLFGNNTAYNAFLELLLHNDINPIDKNFLVIGTGQISKVVQKVLVDLKANVLVVGNVDKKKSKVRSVTRATIPRLKDIYMVINTTSVGGYPDVNEMPLTNKEAIDVEYVTDLVYSVYDTSFIMMYRQKNVKVIHGVYMQIVKILKAIVLFEKDTKLYSINLINDVYQEIMVDIGDKVNEYSTL